MAEFTKNKFLQHFQLSPIGKSEHTFKYANFQKDKPIKKAAVLIPIVDHGHHLTILFTRRSSLLKHHAGQVSFPGGKVDPTDVDAIDTALREATEEINLPRTSVTVIGKLPAYQTFTGFEVTPIIGIIENNVEFTANQGEVSEIFEVPLAHFLSKNNTHHIKVERHNQHYNLTFMPYKHYNIWGATAAMLNDLVNHLLKQHIIK